MSISKDQTTKQCKIERCDGKGLLDKNGKRYIVKGYCARHYKRAYRNADPSDATVYSQRFATLKRDTAEIPIGLNAKDGYSIVDISLAPILEKYKWRLSSAGYAITRTENTTRLLHHMVIGKPPVGLVTDHVNRNKLDNRLSNLRFVTYSENALNTEKRISV